MSVKTMPLWGPGMLCPCTCGATGSKLQTKTGHVVGCDCASCRGRRNRRKGHAAQAKAHRLLGGTGPTPSNEESARVYDLRILPEVKTGAQLPASFLKFIRGEFFKDALWQSERARPPDARAAVVLDCGRDGRYAVVRL